VTHPFLARRIRRITYTPDQAVLFGTIRDLGGCVDPDCGADYCWVNQLDDEAYASFRVWLAPISEVTP
jgi:hypothetical protein